MSSPKIESKQKNEIGYDLWSSFYDRYPNPTVAIDELTFSNCYATLREKNVLEIGCGTGRHTARLISANNDVTGVDISEGMLKQLRSKIRDPRLNLVKADFLQGEIPDGPFDAIVTSLVLEHIADLPLFFSRAKKLIKSGGRFFISDLHPERMQSGIFAHFKDETGTEIHLESVPHQTDQILEAARNSGFGVVEVKSILGNEELVKLNPKWSRYLGLPMIQIMILVALD